MVHSHLGREHLRRRCVAQAVYFVLQLLDTVPPRFLYLYEIYHLEWLIYAFDGDGGRLLHDHGIPNVGAHYVWWNVRTHHLW
jgi:hypothetical protein